MRITPNHSFAAMAAALAVYLLAIGGTYHLDSRDLVMGAAGGLPPLVRWTLLAAGPAAAGQLAIQVLLHSLNSGLVYLVLARFIPAANASFAALIFAVHPLHAEAVNYIGARGILLTAAFLLAGTLSALSRQWIGVGIACAGLLASARLPLPAAGITWADWMGAQGAVLGRYLRQVIFPWGLTPAPDVQFIEWGWIVWIVLAAFLWRYRSHTSARLTMAGLALLAPSLLIPAGDLAADRRMYVPLAAFAGAVAMLPWSRATRWMFVLALALLGVRQTILWSSEETLWRWSVARSPNALRPKLELSRRVKPSECLAILRTAEIRWPEDPRIPAAIAACEARTTAK